MPESPRQLPRNTPSALTTSEVVSSEEELLILVDGDDVEIGQLSKGACHDGAGIRHRAFSLFVFNQAGELLIQQRAAGKRLWPSWWSNSCCSHPRAGESIETAVERRSEQELGLIAQPEYVYKFEYTAGFGTLGTEHELCSVFVANTAAEPAINITEIDAWTWISATDLDRELAREDARFTPWFRLEWTRLRSEFSDRLAACGVQPATRTA